jgi:hypothetical protein
MDTTGVPAGEVARLVRDRCRGWLGFRVARGQPGAEPAGLRRPAGSEANGGGGRVLLLCGPAGADKSTIGFQRCPRAGLAAGYIDLDQIGFLVPRPDGDPRGHGLKAGNLADLPHCRGDAPGDVRPHRGPGRARCLCDRAASRGDHGMPPARRARRAEAADHDPRPSRQLASARRPAARIAGKLPVPGRRAGSRRRPGPRSHPTRRPAHRHHRALRSRSRRPNSRRGQMARPGGIVPKSRTTPLNRHLVRAPGHGRGSVQSQARTGRSVRRLHQRRAVSEPR